MLNEKTIGLIIFKKQTRAATLSIGFGYLCITFDYLMQTVVHPSLSNIFWFIALRPAGF